MKIGQKYRIINFNNNLNGIIVKIIEKHYSLNYYLVEIVDKSLLNNWKIRFYFTNNGNKWNHEKNLKPLRKDKLKRLLK